MTTSNDINQTVKQYILQVAQDQGMEIGSIEDDHSVVEDLGFASLDVATLTALLENAFDVDPFAENMAVITEIRTVADICEVYKKCLSEEQQEPADNSPADSSPSEGSLNRGQMRRAALKRRQTIKEQNK